MALTAMSLSRDPLLNGNEMAGLRAFLRSLLGQRDGGGMECASLTALAEADVEVSRRPLRSWTGTTWGTSPATTSSRRRGRVSMICGKLTGSTNITTQDAAGLFRSIDGAKSGLLTMKSFMSCLGDRVFDAEAERPGTPAGAACRPLARSSSEDAWKSARIPKTPTSSPNLLTSSPVGGALKPPGCRWRAPTQQVAAEQRLRCETEQRLTQHLNSLVGVSISEQLDVLREQLVEERMQRQVDITALRSTLETVRSMALRSVQENLEEPLGQCRCVKSEVDKSMGELRLSFEENNLKKSPEIEKLDQLSRSVEGRLSELERSTRSAVIVDPLERRGGVEERHVEELQKSNRAFEDRLDLLSSNMDLLTSNVELQAKQSLQLKEDVSALQCADIKAQRRLMKEERARTTERSSALTKALTQDFERSIVAQAVAEARTEARAAVSDANPGLQQAVRQLAQDIEALWQKLQGKAQGGLADATRAAEKLCQERSVFFCSASREKMAVTDTALKTQAEALEHLQQKLNVVEESVRIKLQALINKLDSKCIEGLVPVLADLGSALVGSRPKMLSVEKMETSGWCSHSTSSGESRAKRGGVTPAAPPPTVATASPVACGSPPTPSPAQVIRQSSMRSLEESQQIDALVQENLRLREGELRLREQNLEIRERQLRMQEDPRAREREVLLDRSVVTGPRPTKEASSIVPGFVRGTGSARSQSPPTGKAAGPGPAGSVNPADPPMPGRGPPRASVPRHAPPGVARVMASPPMMARNGLDARSDRRGGSGRVVIFPRCLESFGVAQCVPQDQYSHGPRDERSAPCPAKPADPIPSRDPPYAGGVRQSCARAAGEVMQAGGLRLPIDAVSRSCGEEHTRGSSAARDCQVSRRIHRLSTCIRLSCTVPRGSDSSMPCNSPAGSASPAIGVEVEAADAGVSSAVKIQVLEDELLLARRDRGELELRANRASEQLERLWQHMCHRACSGAQLRIGPKKDKH
eukprot:g17039.t1